MSCLRFKLSMPCTNSWNGRWTGAEKDYSVYRSIGRSQDSKARAERMLATGRYSYSFGDGWVAAIEVTKVDRKKKSDGFCGYEWMIYSIIDRDKITTEKKGAAE